MQKERWRQINGEFVGTLAIVGLGTIIYNAAQPIMALFTNAEDVIHIGIYYLYAIAIAEPFLCAAIISGGALRGQAIQCPLSLIHHCLPMAHTASYCLPFGLHPWVQHIRGMGHHRHIQCTAGGPDGSEIRRWRLEKKDNLASTFL